MRRSLFRVGRSASLQVGSRPVRLLTSLSLFFNSLLSSSPPSPLTPPSLPPSLSPLPPPSLPFPTEELLGEEEGAELHPELDPGLEEEDDDRQFEVLETVGEVDAGLRTSHAENRGPVEEKPSSKGLFGQLTESSVWKGVDVSLIWSFWFAGMVSRRDKSTDQQGREEERRSAASEDRKSSRTRSSRTTGGSSRDDGSKGRTEGRSEKDREGRREKEKERDGGRSREREEESKGDPLLDTHKCLSVSPPLLAGLQCTLSQILTVCN